MNIGSAVKQLRKDAKLNQGELAQIIGITQGYLCKVEKNSVKIATEEILQRICDALEVPLAVLYVMAIEQNDITRNNPADRNILHMLETGKELILKAL